MTSIEEQIQEDRHRIEAGLGAHSLALGIMHTEMNAGFAAVNDRIDGLENRIDGLETKMSAGFDAVSDRFDRIEALLERLTGEGPQ